ncbi:hypothetical protein G4Y79_11380 [Phototrophicus methaneseepsis]|uniref:Peptidase M14 domain-containing protein n=1 Tax=Phototrophicus methaneseepsis TaxID=2710758 RepID=A0A7S8EDF0_9CHLR|nr:M14 family zinc carboxypeptidase [Phototrophicus methaneseepsis]QPC84937.1 hypothetical protein G4Y79_11380 [Phototrophicus methaneseepsis]
MNLTDIAASIPEYDHFLTVDEMTESNHRLAEAYPDLVSIRTIGETRRGDPIEMLTIQGGPLQALAFGGPHPNEPIGCMTLEYLTKRLCEDDELRNELGFTWHIIKSIDSDGMRLNEGWFKGPFTPANYARNFFRPASHDQVEWTFPIDYKTLHFHSPIPETQALMSVIDELQPTLLYSLHNAGFGGVYYYTSGGSDELFKLFHEIPSWFNLNLDLGEPEVNYAVQLAPAIYKMLTVREGYDYMAENGIEDPAKEITSGGSSAEYSEKYGSHVLVVELPYYDDPRVNDQTETDMLRRDAILQGLDDQDAFDKWVEDQLDTTESELSQETLISRAVFAFIKRGKTSREASRQWAKTAEETNRPATQAEVFSNLLISRFYRLLTLGMYARVMDDEVANGNTSEIILNSQKAARQRFEEQATALENDLDYRALPIRSLVGVQVCAGLATAAYLRDLAAEKQ